ncbi:tyrosine-type recombinase/integrase [Candidatus Curtissbacteria bacterium]|nr:tyrosine-type recombinase/integrase [Candidatus Curtissbacteria bacterium]
MATKSDPIALKNAHQTFIDHLRGKNRASATVLAYGKDIEQLVAFLQELQKNHVHEVSTADINAFLAKLGKEGYTPKSVSRKLNSTKTFFRFLKIEEIITDDPSAMVAHPKFETKQPRVLTPLEYRALRDAARSDARISAVIELLLQTGMRIGELARIRIEDIFLSEGKKEGRIYIRPFEGHTERTIPLNAAAEEAVKRYLKERKEAKPDDNLFVTKNNKPLLIRNIRTAIDRYFKKAGIAHAKVNDLRHTWVHHHLSRGTSVVLISKLAGHKRLSTTERYLGLIEPKKNSEKVKLEEL